jgi:ABC-2 type transport system permease protein
MNIFRRELKANLKSLIIWCVCMGLFILLGVSKFSAYYNNPQMLAILDSLPKSVTDAMSLRAFNLTTLNGFYGIMFVYFALLGAIAAALWGSESISKEERDKTVEFSLVLPVTRSKVITGKALAALVNCVVFVVVTALVSIAVAQQYKPDQTFYSFLLLEMVAMFLLELVFLAVGLLLGCAMKQYKRSASIGIAIILVTYFLSILSGLKQNLDFLKYFSPFKYFDAAKLLNSAISGSLQGSVSGTFLLLSAAIIVVCIVGAYLTYNKRDLYI